MNTTPLRLAGMAVLSLANCAFAATDVGQQTRNVVTSVEYDASIPQLAFAAQDFNAALKEAERENLNVALTVKPDEWSPEAFQIRSVGQNQIPWNELDANAELKDLPRIAAPSK